MSQVRMTMCPGIALQALFCQEHSTGNLCGGRHSGSRARRERATVEVKEGKSHRWQIDVQGQN